MLEYWNGGMLGKDCSTCWRAGVLACTRTGEDARTPILKHPIIPTFQHSIIPLLVTPLFVTAHCYCPLLLPTATADCYCPSPGGALACDINWGHRHPACALAEQARCLFSQCLMFAYNFIGMLGKDFSNMLACRRPRLHTYGRGRPYADIETPHYSNIPTFHYSSSSYSFVCH
jgi:hypothetical protein